MLAFHTVANIEACERPFFLLLIVVDFELLSRDLYVVVDILCFILSMGVQGVDGGIVILILVGLNNWSVIFVFDQLNFGFMLDARRLFQL